MVRVLKFISVCGGLPNLTGPIFSLRLLGQNVIVLNSHKAAVDLLGTPCVIMLSRYI
jgi:hypothetical protein